MRLDKSSFDKIDNKIKDHKMKRLDAVRQATVIRTDILNNKNTDLSTIGLTKINDELDVQLQDSMVDVGILKKK